MNALLSSLRHGYSNLTNFGGRDTRAAFWPFALVHTGALMAIWMPFFMIEFTRSFTPMQDFARANPDKATIVDAPGRYSITVHEPVPGLGPDIETMMLPLAFLVPIFFVLVAAAVARRLHDVGWPGWIGLIPASLFAGSGVLMVRMFTAAHQLGEIDDGFTGLLLGAIGLTFAYNISLVVLIILCVLPSSQKENRYGPAPD